MTEEELDQSGMPPPFWAFAWAGGQAVARYLLDHPQLVAGKRVLDLAAGSGMCAIASRLAGASSAVAADIDLFAGAAVELNAAANGVRVRYVGHDLIDQEPPDVDMVLAGDVCYEHAMATRILPWLQRAAAAGIGVLLGDPRRRYLPAHGLIELAAYDVPTTPDLEESDYKTAGVYVFG